MSAHPIEPLPTAPAGCPEADSAWTTRRQIAGAATGPLRQLRFAVKDLIAVQGCVMSSGNPHWGCGRTPEQQHAVCVRRLLEAGASCLGTTWLDEFAFGLSGENPWGGTPANPAAPGRIPGGSSSGSAVVVARGEVDLALGTDTAGSVRVPASWCGIGGLRPSHGLIPMEGVAPLAPSLDTIGLFAARSDVLRAGATVLLAGAAAPAAPVRALGLLAELWELAEPAAAALLLEQAQSLAQRLRLPLQRWSLAELGVAEPADLRRTLQAVQWAEIEQSLAALPADLPIGPVLRRNRLLVAERDRQATAPAERERERLRRRLQEWLGPAESPALLLLPATPGVAPPLSSLGIDRSVDHVLQCLLTLNALASLAGLPQISLPGPRLNGLPLGLGVISAAGCDLTLLQLEWPLHAGAV
ncbi:MAG: amidase family protein [Synechococcaceae cyanobacterium]|nr:amidase family protein [Synechococcaceae cyanobacterium]